MKRFHIHVGVRDLEKSVQFYSTLFGQNPDKLKSDYAKWMLEDPRINFAISTRASEKGVDHLGIQVEQDNELAEITERLKRADLGVYAESKKAWVQDPSGIPWETYRTMADAETFHGKPKVKKGSSCCEPGDSGSCCT